MQAAIDFDHVSVSLRRYHDQGISAKERFIGLFHPRQARKRYADFLALDAISFTIKDGERVGIVGANGAGKSTLLRTLCGIYTPTAGRVTVTGAIASMLEIGAGFNAELTGRENIYLNGAALGHSRAELRQIEPEIIAFSELAEFIDTPVKYYSTGMYMRLAFCIATSIKPDILVLDEVFAGGDAHFIGKATARMQSFVDQARVMILVSHQPELLRQLCNRGLWIDHGRLVADGPVGEVVDRYLAATS